MHDPSVPAGQAPSRLARRLVLGAAFLIGLAVALTPRTATVHAQEPKASTPAPKAQSGSKSVTITDGHGQPKIEIRKEGDAAAKPSATPGDSPDDEDSAASGGKSGAGRAITIGKGRIQIDGLGDKEFDSVGEFVQHEPEIAGMVVAIVTVIFLSPVLMIALVLWYRMRKTRMLNETMLKLAEKGIVTSSDALEALAGGKQAAAVATAAAAVAPLQEQAKQMRRRAAWSDLRKGVFTAGVGIALTLYSLFDDGSPNGLGLVLIFVGVGFLVLWWFEERQLAPPGATPGAGASVGASGPPTGGSPPPA
jgi:hypothetical protein